MRLGLQPNPGTSPAAAPFFEAYQRSRIMERLSVEQRFWTKVNKDGPIHPIYGQCWEWTAAKTKHGYGVLRVKKKNLYMHRYSFSIHFWETSKNVLHKCDNPGCVNPGHLFEGTQLDNISDMIVKQRHSRGENNGNNKLNNDIVRWARANYIRGHKTLGGAAMARTFGVRTSVMLDAIYGSAWNHID